MIDSKSTRNKIIENKFAEIDTLIVGGGISGLYISAGLSDVGISSLVLEGVIVHPWALA